MKTYTLTAALLLIPFFAFAQFGVVDDFFGNIMTFINDVLVPLIFAVALFMFVYGMYKYFIYKGATSSVAEEEGKNLMIYAIVAFVLMISIWGIVNLLAGGLQEGLGTQNNINPSSLPKGPQVGG